MKVADGKVAEIQPLLQAAAAAQAAFWEAMGALEQALGIDIESAFQDYTHYKDASLMGTREWIETLEEEEAS